MICRNICMLSILGLFFTFTFTGHPSDAQATRAIKVYVDVDCDNENTEFLIKSWTKRELRNLPDVKIVGIVDAEMILSLLILEPKYKSGKQTGGIVISYLFLQRDLTSHDIAPRFYFPKMGVVTGDKSHHIEGFCKNIVAEFDTTHIEPVRIAKEVAEDIIRQYREYSPQ